MGKDGNLFAQARSARYYALLCSDKLPSLHMLYLERCHGELYLLFLDGGSPGNLGSGGSVSLIAQLQHQTRAACGMWVSRVAYGSADTLTMSRNIGGSFKVFDNRKQEAVYLCMSLETVRQYLYKNELYNLHTKLTWCDHFEQHAPSLTISMSPAGDIVIAHTTKWGNDWRILV